MNIDRHVVSVVASSLIASQILSVQPASAQTARPQSTNPFEALCPNKMGVGIAELTDLLMACGRGYINETDPQKAAYFAARAAIAAQGMIAADVFYHRPKDTMPFQAAETFTKIVQDYRLNVDQIWKNLRELDNEFANPKRWVSSDRWGMETTKSAICIYGQPLNQNNKSGIISWINICADAYNATRSGAVAGNYARGMLWLSSIEYQAGDMGGVEHLKIAQRYRSVFRSYGYTSGQDDEAADKLARSYVDLKTQQETRSTLTPGQVALGLAAVGAVALLLFGNRSSQGSGSSSSSSSHDARNDPDYDLERYRTRPEPAKPLPEPPPRSYGLYGDCPLSGAGYGC